MTKRQYTPEHLELLDWPGLGHYRDHYVAPCTQDWGMDPLTEANWEVQQEALAGTSAFQQGFAMLIPPHDTAALKIADELAAAYADYPCLDESLWSEKEHENEQQQWDDWGRYEFRKELVKRFEGEDMPLTAEWIEDMPDEAIDEIYWLVCVALGRHPEQSGGDVHFNVEDCARWVELDALPPMPPMPRLNGCGPHTVPVVGCELCIKARDAFKPYHGHTLGE